MRPYEMRRTKKRERTVSRAYGGSRCHLCVKGRIMRAFLIEEQKIVRSVMQQAQASQNPKKKKNKKKKGGKKK